MTCCRQSSFCRRADAATRPPPKPRLAAATRTPGGARRAGRRGRDRVGFIVAAPGTHQDPQKMAALLGASPDPLESQFRATYTTLLNLLDAYGNFAQVREIAARSFAHRETVERVARMEHERAEAGRRIERKLKDAGCEFSVDAARGLERLASARDKLLGGAPQTRTEVFFNWVSEVV